MLCVAAGWSFAFKTTSMVSGPAPIGSGTGHLRAGFSNSWWKAENAEGDGAFPEHLHPSTMLTGAFIDFAEPRRRAFPRNAILPVQRQRTDGRA